MARKIPLADRMYEVLLHQLMDGKRAPGDTLNISALTRELDVSQTPLREALARLEHSGLVYREALKGYKVAPPFTREDIIALMEARKVLEPAVVMEVARHVTPELIAELKQTIEDLASVANGADSSTKSFYVYWSSDHRFHNLIAEHSGNPFLCDAYRTLSGHIQRFRLFAKLGATSAGEAVTEHQRVLEALERGDAEAAAQAMVEHVEGSSRRALSGIPEAPEPTVAPA